MNELGLLYELFEIKGPDILVFGLMLFNTNMGGHLRCQFVMFDNV